MKKLLAVMITLSLVFVLGACAEAGDYEPGVYFGYTDGHENTTAVVVINENGHIEEIFVDTIYMKSEADGPVSWVGRGGAMAEGIATTKQSLDNGCAYNMWPTVNHWGNAIYGAANWDGTDDDNYDDVLALFEAKEYCEAPPEHLMWHEQVRALIEEILEAQAIPELPMDGDYLDQDHDDAIAGVTVSINTYVAAIEAALEQAGK